MDIVRDIYVDHPFPRRDPEDERKRLRESSFGQIKLVKNLLWGGKKDKMRILDAGCGTGDFVIYAAEQLKDTGSEIIALDISESALDIVKKRAEIRGLKNIIYICDSILNIPKLGLGKFDYIVCSSVLPHLDSPSEGLKILNDVLAEDGGMGIQIYAKYGRYPIEILQKIFKKIPEEDLNKKIKNAEELVACLPKNHWFKILTHNAKYSELKYDMALHSYTSSYSVPELYELVNGAGLSIIRFVNKMEYDPSFYLRGKFPEFKELSAPEQHEIAELLNGRIIKHLFFCTKNSHKLPTIDSENDLLIPVYVRGSPEFRESNGKILATFKSLFKVSFEVNPIQAEILRQIDGKKNTGDLLEAVAKKLAKPQETVLDEWRVIFKHADLVDLVVLDMP